MSILAFGQLNSGSHIDCQTLQNDTKFARLTIEKIRNNRFSETTILPTFTKIGCFFSISKWNFYATEHRYFTN